MIRPVNGFRRRAACLKASTPLLAGGIIGASRPEQVVDNARAVDVTLDAATLAAIDEALGDAVQADPSLTQANAPAVRPA